MDAKSAAAALAELKSVDRWMDGVLFVGMAIVLFSYFAFDVSHETHPVLNALLGLVLVGAMVVPLLIWHFGKGAIMRRHGLRCPHCAAVPLKRYANETLEKNRCLGCGGKMVPGR